jgi:hypothetical protein
MMSKTSGRKESNTMLDKASTNVLAPTELERDLVPAKLAKVMTALSPMFDDDEFVGSGVIRGTYLKENHVDGTWAAGGVDMTNKVVRVVGYGTVVQHRENGQVVETITEKPFPDIVALNNAIPREQWEVRYGKSQEPWQIAVVVYVIDEVTREIFTFINSTATGARRAYQRLRDSMRVTPGFQPRVKLTSRPQPNSYGSVTQAPRFEIIDWVRIDPAEPLKLTTTADAKPPAGEQKPGDGEIPFNDGIPF